MADPVVPEPDNKDWTWTLERSCSECGYDANTYGRDEIGSKIRTTAATWRSLLGAGSLASKRPPDGDPSSPIWSAVEYGAHVRDVYKLFGDRFDKMLKKKNPKFRDWDQNKAAVKGKYHSQEPDQVAYELAVAAGGLADRFDKLSDDGWAETGQRSDGVSFTVETLGRYLLHDVFHHINDVEAGYKQLKS